MFLSGKDRSKGIRRANQRNAFLLASGPSDIKVSRPLSFMANEGGCRKKGDELPMGLSVKVLNENECKYNLS